jgi:hypothetical protein
MEILTGTQTVIGIPRNSSLWWKSVLQSREDSMGLLVIDCTSFFFFLTKNGRSFHQQNKVNLFLTPAILRLLTSFLSHKKYLTLKTI